MKVKRSETIKKLKVMVCRKEGISVDVQELFFGGDHLKDGQRILDYGIPGDSTVHLVSKESSQMRLYFNMPSNEKTIELQVLKGDTIQKIKPIIQYKEGICPHDFEIYSSGRLLENHKTVASLNIQSKDTLQMISNRNDTRSISVQTPTKGVIEVEVRLIHSVLDVKKIIESMINICSQRMKLFIDGTEEQLENSKTLACYDIDEGDILTIQYSDVFQISVRTYNGNTFTLDVTSSSTVYNVKQLLYELIDKQ
ncbi:hypothetical protein Dsin_029927 [Dipteronia sinensis]|uniref:Ubiquitin-like domain-containing protein n=1 Tax=Dipteronia sinensis TaxID=43782 RepID=A0AAD9ZUV5_9ROSI|nr:hypothetical protein Dsin_029927 [Dipteronia sinensis]